MKTPITLTFFLVVALAACSPATPSANMIGTAIVQTQAAVPTATLIPTATPYPTFTPFPSFTPPPTYTSLPTMVVPTARVIVVTATYPATEIMAEIAGQGNVVTENYNWGACQKAVFVWEALGRDNMIAYIFKIGVTDNVLLVNEIGPDAGEVLQPLAGGTYYLSVEGPSEGWTIRLECR